MNSRFSFGDLVVMKSGPAPAPKATRDATVAMIAELRKDDCRAQYLLEERSVWTSLADLRPAREDETTGSIERTVHDLLTVLKAVEMEFTRLDPQRCRLVASHGAFAPETLDQARAMLDGRLIRCLVRPQGMHRIQTIFEFSILDPADGAG